MPKFRQTSEILKLMGEKERIRNVGVIAHIDHGKTTMTDSLLIEAGFLPQQVAVSARALDYLPEEQKRGITIKTANISFLHQVGKSPYLINLVDTPGHVDFAGKVARALRAIDGAVVVVDAVEEVMAQTETVTKQALEERVRPVLFINKLDRLIKELRLSPREIEEKSARIINDFNNVIEIYGEPEFKEKWKVAPEKESVAFGSALHRWGFTLRMAERKGVRFGDHGIIEAYKKERYQALSQIVPLHTAILDMIVKNVPSPVESQRYRVPKIWRGRLDSDAGQAMLNCNDDGPTVMCITAVHTVEEERLIATGRIFSGSLSKGDKVYLIEAGKTTDIEQVSIHMSAFREAVGQIPSGNIASLTIHGLTRAGDTLVDFEHKDMVVPFENIRYVSEPVMTLAVEPRNPKDLSRVLEALNRLSKEDPNIITSVNTESGQYLVSGMGELHLEVSMNFLKEYVGDTEVNVSSPSTAYRESIFKKGALAMAKSPNKRNSFSVLVEPIEGKVMASLEKTMTLPEDMMKQTVEGEVWALDQHVNILLNLTHFDQHVEDVKNSIVSGFSWACRTGPMCEQPIRGMKVKLIDAQLDPYSENREQAQVMRAVSRAILGSFLSAQPVILEPIYKTEVSVPMQWFGTCSNIITRKRGRIESTEQKGALAVIVGYIPVAQTLGLSTEMRTATSGRAFWQLVFDHWETMPEKLANEMVKQLRERKGLPSQTPKPETFADEIHV